MNDRSNDVAGADELRGEAACAILRLPTQDGVGEGPQMSFERVESERDRRGRGDNKPAWRLPRRVAEQRLQIVDRDKRAAKTGDTEERGRGSGNASDLAIHEQAGNFGDAQRERPCVHPDGDEIMFAGGIDPRRSRERTVEFRPKLGGAFAQARGRVGHSRPPQSAAADWHSASKASRAKTPPQRNSRA